MHSKIINPSNNSNSAVYSNNGSSKRAVTYFGKEETEERKAFFSADISAEFSKEDVIKAIDNNVKGLKDDEEKFDSIIISPSEAELNHIGNDPEKLKAFARHVMKNYIDAYNFPGNSSVLLDLQKQRKILDTPVKFVGSGSANYQFDEKNKASYYVSFKNNKGEVITIWGADLQPAIEATNPAAGDKVIINNLGKEPVKVQVDVFVNGLKTQEEREVLKNKWEVLNPEAIELKKVDIDNKMALEKDKIAESPRFVVEPVWFATIHHNRQYDAIDVKLSKRVTDLKDQGLSLKEIKQIRETDFFLKTYKASNSHVERFYRTGTVNLEDNKQGDQRHIHIIVSRRDKEMKKTLNPNNRKRFNRYDFMKSNAMGFKEKHNFKGVTWTLDEKRTNGYAVRIEHLNKKYNLPDGYLDEKKIIDTYNNTQDKEKFNKNFNRLEYKLKKGEAPEDPMKVLEPDLKETKGKDQSKLFESLFADLGNLADRLESGGEFVLPTNQRRKLNKKVRNIRDAEHERSR